MANFNYIAYLGQSNAPVQVSSFQPSGARMTGQEQQTVQEQRTLQEQQTVNLYLKVLSPDNKKEYKTVNLRGLCKEYIDTPAKLKAVICSQCKTNDHDLNPEKLEVGYFRHSTKLWINNRLDIDDVWNGVEKGAKITLWCLDTSREPQKRKRDEQEDENVTPPKKKNPPPGSTEEKRAKIRESEMKLQEMHKEKYTPFQYKLWAEMLVIGTHHSFSEPPSSSMFDSDKKRSSCSNADVNTMVTAMNTLSQALVLKEVSVHENKDSLSSPMKKAQLRGTYMKQLNELRQLYDNQILSKDEYEEQRLELIVLLRELREK